MEPAVRARIDALIEDGAEIFDRFDRTVREKIVSFLHRRRLQAGARDAGGSAQFLAVDRRDGPPRFLEFGSATGVITVVADLLGFDACGIELDPDLVAIARQLAVRYESRARFAIGSFLPAEYRWKPDTGDGRMGTIGSGPRRISSWDVPWTTSTSSTPIPGKAKRQVMVDLMRQYGDPDAQLLIMDAVEGLRIADRGGKPRH